MKRRFASLSASLSALLSALLITAAALVGCAGPAPSDYAAEKPVLDLKTYFNGELTAHGVYTDRRGLVARRFVVQMTGTWQGKIGMLDERFTYSDGTTERRVWKLTDERGARVVVSARSREPLDAFVAAHPGSLALPLDATDQAAMHAAAAQIVASQGGIDLVSSVAGFRGLPKSLAYGPTKAALINLAETLYLDLSPLGLGVSVINPGFVETPLTAGNEFKMPALITPAQAAVEIEKGWRKGEFEIHFPKRFTLWLKGLRHLGYGAYFALVRRSTGLR